MLVHTVVMLLAGLSSGQSTDFVVGAGETVFYDTSVGPLRTRNLVIGEGGVLRAMGPNPLLIRASGRVQIDGTLDLSGFAGKNVATLNTGNQAESGGPGGPGGGAGGDASRVTTSSTPAGSTGLDAALLAGGGIGGESGFAISSLGTQARRPGGGGGGALALDQPVDDNPADPSNDGLIAQDGHDGDVLSTGAVSGQPPAQGGASAQPIFIDGDPTNDFAGIMPDGQGGFIVGELDLPTGGRGGGGGGDALPSSSFPTPNWTPASDEKGGAGGGGGGLGIVFARIIIVGSNGLILCNGGQGALGENTSFLDSIGGNGGGGSGGTIVLRALVIDLSQASDDALSAIGGLGGVNLSGILESNGGNGGPGVIQLHTPEAHGIHLPPGKRLSDLSKPDAYSLFLR